MSTAVRDNLVLTDEFGTALRRLENGDHLFLTGKAGTGKSTLIRHYMATTDRNVVVVAPTGIAALNVEGYTIHRLFSFYPGITADEVRSGNYYPGRFAQTLKQIDTLIIDEASMVRADLFDRIAAALERFGPAPGSPFGGIQLVLVGDLFQLPPVVTESEREYFGTRYATPYFFSADSYDRERFPMVQLTTVFRQQGDSRLVDILNSVRDGALLEDARRELNARTEPDFEPPPGEFWLTLTTTNNMASSRNRRTLEQLDGPELRSTAIQRGDLQGFDKPTDADLVFKTGAQIMMLINDPSDRFVNGTIGRIITHEIVEDEPEVTIQDDDGAFFTVGPHTWDITQPVVEGGALRSEVVGTYTQLPFRLAWAVTVHKSQGQTLDRLVVDLTGGTFADGQLYVALSRATSLEGLVLRRDVLPRDSKVDQRIRRFLQSDGAAEPSRGQVYLGICSIGTVGSRWRPRPVEIALVTDDGDEVSTLVNPTQDLFEARQEFGITPADVQLAPLLAEAWVALAPILAGRTPVGVDIDQTLGGLDFELKRNGIVSPMPLGLDITSQARPADRAALRAGTALERARAVREIAQRTPEHDAFAEVFADPPERAGYLLPRGTDPMSFLVGGHLPAGESAESALVAQLRVTAQRAPLLAGSREILGAIESATGGAILDPSSAAPYAKRPGNTDPGGGAGGSAVGGAAGPSAPDEALRDGVRVCFSGDSAQVGGTVYVKEALQHIAEEHGLEVKGNVTKTRCDVLVTAEQGSMSNKAKKAHQYGKPILSAAEFLAWTRGEVLPESTPSNAREVRIGRMRDVGRGPAADVPA